MNPDGSIGMEDFQITDEERLGEAGHLIVEMIHFARYRWFFRATCQTSTGNVVVVDQQHLDAPNSDCCRYRWKILPAEDQKCNGKVMAEGFVDDSTPKFLAMMEHMDGYHQTQELHEAEAERVGKINDKLKEYENGLDGLLYS